MQCVFLRMLTFIHSIHYGAAAYSYKQRKSPVKESAFPGGRTCLAAGQGGMDRGRDIHNGQLPPAPRAQKSPPEGEHPFRGRTSVAAAATAMRVKPLGHVQRGLYPTAASRCPRHAHKKKAPRKGFILSGGRRWRRPTLPPCGAVPSARAGLTSLFGMGRGGAPQPWPP